jgi:hypothetical protein
VLLGGRPPPTSSLAEAPLPGADVVTRTLPCGRDSVDADELRELDTAIPLSTRAEPKYRVS